MFLYLVSTLVAVDHLGFLQQANISYLAVPPPAGWVLCGLEGDKSHAAYPLLPEALYNLNRMTLNPHLTMGKEFPPSLPIMSWGEPALPEPNCCKYKVCKFQRICSHLSMLLLLWELVGFCPIVNPDGTALTLQPAKHHLLKVRSFTSGFGPQLWLHRAQWGKQLQADLSLTVLFSSKSTSVVSLFGLQYPFIWPLLFLLSPNPQISSSVFF